MAKGMKGALFEHEMRETSRLFGRDHDISVVFIGDKAGREENTIIYPALQSNSNLSGSDVMIGRGFVDHEAAHIRYSDQKFIETKEAELDAVDRDLLKKTFTAIEDVRVEALANRDYVGAKKNLSKTAEAVNESFHDAYTEDNSIVEDDRVIPLALTWEGREEMSYDTPKGKECLDALPEKFSKPVAKWAKEMAQCKSTQDSWELAKRIAYDMEEDNHQDQNYESQPTGKGMPEGFGEEGEGKGQKKQPGEGQPEGEPDKFSTEFSDVIDKSNGGGTWEREDGDYRPWTSEYDRFHHHTDKRVPHVAKNGSLWNAGAGVMKPNRSIVQYNQTLSESAGNINVIRRKLELAIQSMLRQDWDFGREQGRLDTRRLVAAYNGMTNVYKERQECPALDTAVTILIDQSGSMCGSRIRVAYQVTVALYECLYKIGVPFEVIGFTDGNALPDQQAIERQNKLDWSTYSKHHPLHLFGYKTFKDRPLDARASIPAMLEVQRKFSSMTPNGEALLGAFARINKRPESRKIILNLCDGGPGAVGYGDEHQHMRNAVNIIEEAGTDLIGIGIQSEEVRHYFPTWTICNSLEDLPKKTINMLAQALIGDPRYVADNSELMNATKRKI